MSPRFLPIPPQLLPDHEERHRQRNATWEMGIRLGFERTRAILDGDSAWLSALGAVQDKIARMDYADPRRPEAMKQLKSLLRALSNTQPDKVAPKTRHRAGNAATGASAEGSPGRRLHRWEDVRKPPRERRNAGRGK